MSGVQALANPRRIKAAHRRRRKVASGQSVQRYYDPAIGSFLSVDPVTAYDNGDMRHFNRYTYAYNNPYAFTDPDGRCPSCIGAGIGGGLELAFQLATPQGRAAYAAAGAALAKGDLGGAFKAAGANVAKVGASAAAGAVGAGLAGKIAQGANMVSKGMNGSSATANVAANVGIKVAGNAAAGAVLGATTQGVGNAVSGQPLTEGVTGAAVGGAIGGAVGTGLEAALTPAAQNLANGTGRMIGSSAGTAVPGASGPATALGERAGAIGGAAAEKAATCTKGIGGGC